MSEKRDRRVTRVPANSGSFWGGSGFWRMPGRGSCWGVLEAGDRQLHAAVGEEHGDGGEGGAPGVYAGGEPDAGGRARRERQSGGVRAEGGGICAGGWGCGRGGTGITGSRWCFRTGRGLWGCRGRRRRCGGFRRFADAGGRGGAGGATNSTRRCGRCWRRRTGICG